MLILDHSLTNLAVRRSQLCSNLCTPVHVRLAACCRGHGTGLILEPRPENPACSGLRQQAATRPFCFVL